MIATNVPHPLASTTNTTSRRQNYCSGTVAQRADLVPQIAKSLCPVTSAPSEVLVGSALLQLPRVRCSTASLVEQRTKTTLRFSKWTHAANYRKVALSGAPRDLQDYPDFVGSLLGASATARSSRNEGRSR